MLHTFEDFEEILIYIVLVRLDNQSLCSHCFVTLME